MKKIITLILISVSIISFAQNKKELIASAKKAIDDSKVQSVTIAGKSSEESLQKTILFSKGEAFTEKEWQEYRKQVFPLVREFFKRDSVHNKFLNNTVLPYLIKGDTIESFNITLEGIFLKLKPRKN